MDLQGGLLLAGLLAGAILMMPAVVACVLGHRQAGLVVHESHFLMREEIDAFLKRLDRRFGSRWLPPSILIGLLLFLGRWAGWGAIDCAGATRIIATGMAAIVAWHGATLPVNVAMEQRRSAARLAVLASAALVWWHPAALVALLSVAIHELHAWEHHRHMPIRALFSIVSFALVCGVAGVLGLMGDVSSAWVSTTLLFLVLTVIASHYVIPLIGKLRLGPHPLHWALTNRFDCLAACAYWWGWRRDRTQSQVLRTSAQIRRANAAFGLFTLGSEGAMALLLLDPHWAIAALGSVVLLHLGIYLVCGLLFWEYAITAGLVAVVLATSMDLPAVASVFSPWSVALSLFVIWFSVYVLKAWVPWRISWWDGPLVVTIDLIVVGRSGREYSLESSLFGPNNRPVARGVAFSHLDERTVQNHPGSRIDCMDAQDGNVDLPGSVSQPTDPRRVRDALVESEGDAEAIEEIRSKYGRSRYQPEVAAAFDRFLRAYFAGLDAGRSVWPVPRWLRWISAPPDLAYKKGEAPPYRAQEPVAVVRLERREAFHCGDRFLTKGPETVYELEL